MGLYDREYYREEPRGFFLGGQTMVVNLVIINVVIALADWLFFKGQLSESLELKADLVRQPWNAWQLITYGFAHDSSGVWHVAFNMLALWFFGREMELFYGRRDFLAMYLTAIIFSGLCWLAVENLLFSQTGSRLVGASGGVIGVMVLYVIHYPTRTIYIWGVIPVPAWLLAALYLLSNVQAFQATVAADGVTLDRTAYAAHLGGAAYGALFYRTRWSLGRLLPKKLSWKALKPRPALRLHEPAHDDRALDERVDEILDKISREGEASLTRDERRTLEDASKRFQKRRR